MEAVNLRKDVSNNSLSPLYKLRHLCRLFLQLSGGFHLWNFQDFTRRKKFIFQFYLKCLKMRVEVCKSFNVYIFIKKDYLKFKILFSNHVVMKIKKLLWRHSLTIAAFQYFTYISIKANKIWNRINPLVDKFPCSFYYQNHNLLHECYNVCAHNLCCIVKCFRGR